MRRVAVVLALVLTLPPVVQAIEVETQHESGVSFSAYATFAWKTEVPDPETDPEGRARLVDQIVREAVESELKAKGLVPAGGEPDLWISYVAFSQAAAHGAIYHGHGGFAGLELRRTEIYAEGNLVLEFLDGSTEKLVWRGWARAGINPEKVGKKARKAVRKMLQRFPPKD